MKGRWRSWPEGPPRLPSAPVPAWVPSAPAPLVVLAALAVILAVAGCGGGGEPAVRLEVAARAPVRFGAFPFRERAALAEALAPLLGWLQERLGRPVRLVVIQNYAELDRLIRQRRIDLGWFTPRRRPGPDGLGMVPIGQPVIEGEGGAYHGIVVARRDRGFRGLADLAGGSFAYVDRQSKSGFLLPNRLLLGAGLEPLRAFRRVEFAGTHDRCLEEILAGRADAGAVTDLLTRSHAWEAAFRDDLQILASTAPILPDPLVARADDPDLAPASLTALLTGMVADPAGRAALDQLRQRLGITGFRPPDPSADR
ncbi:MAG: phosphate/phosphite/phosphonate ABC transporter substrate-binding protein [Candidatus Riflebacteria bacterium]|nr:phosphate/phosphite/phosphonate ABC transporter substrate-binding protein [Candidatus Riflebacteria bacterium]